MLRLYFKKTQWLATFICNYYFFWITIKNRIHDGKILKSTFQLFFGNHVVKNVNTLS